MRTACINPKRINQARLAAAMSQADVAYRLRQHGHKATERSIRRWESGQHAPHANVVPILAEALGISIGSLYEQSEDDDEDDEVVVLRRIAHQLIDRGQTDLASDLLGEVQRITNREKSTA